MGIQKNYIQADDCCGFNDAFNTIRAVAKALQPMAEGGSAVKALQVVTLKKQLNYTVGQKKCTFFNTPHLCDDSR